LDAGDAFVPTGGRFSAHFPLTIYIGFAYKLSLTQEQRDSMLVKLPKWVGTDSFEIEARAQGNPTKDQFRLMMQSLLADRFGLVVHFEAQQVPLLALRLIKPGKTGAKLLPHSDGPPCDAAPGPPSHGPLPVDTDLFPPRCDVYAQESSANPRMNLAGSRNTTMGLLAESLPSLGRLGRPVVDQTGLDGRFDFRLQWTPEPNGPAPPSADVQPDSQGPTFLEALHDQLGLKLESTKGPLQILVVDHVERTSEN